jgi:RNA polymerase sigma factor (sigma-70 family)
VQDDATRFTALYHEFYPRVLAYSRAHSDADVAEDIAHETFLVAWRRWPEVPADGALPWLLAVARNVRLQQRDSGRRRQTLADRIAAQTTDRDRAAWDTADLVVDRAAGLAAVAMLNEADTEVLLLKAWHGLTATQAAKVLGCSKATYFVRLHRARKRLAQALHSPAGPAPATVMFQHQEGRAS